MGGELADFLVLDGVVEEGLVAGDEVGLGVAGLGGNCRRRCGCGLGRAFRAGLLGSALVAELAGVAGGAAT